MGSLRPEIKIQEKKAEDFILEANQKAMGRTAFVGALAEKMFLEAWKSLGPQAGLSDAVIDESMDECIHYAEMWREKINKYQYEQAQAIHDEESNKASKSGLVLPTWGEIKHHYPNGMLN